MDALSGLAMGFSVMLTPANLYYCFLGSLIGTMVGVLPGLGPLAALALLLPVTFTLSPIAGLAMLAAIFYGAMYGGSTTSILVNIPGEAASVITCLDGHQMALKGRAGAALGMAALGSFIAGTLSLVVLTFFAPALAAIAIRFGPPENFGLMALGLVCTLFMITGSKLKGLLMIALGFLLSSVGMDMVNGNERFTFGITNLTAGVELLAAAPPGRHAPPPSHAPRVRCHWVGSAHALRRPKPVPPHAVQQQVRGSARFVLAAIEH